MAALALTPAGSVTAQTFTTLHNFSATSGPGPDPYYTNSDGAFIDAGLIVSGNTLYGTAAVGGTSGHGTVFRMNIDGTGFTNLHNFTTTAGGLSANSDGAIPYAALLLSGGTLYGTANYGGASGNGTVFKVNTDGTGFTNLHSFSGSSDGVNPYAPLILSGNILYGTANRGGRSDQGAVFALNTNGAGFTNLHSFGGVFVNDGAYPTTGLVFTNGILYGTASSGGGAGNGTVFALSTNGTGFTNLHGFTMTDDFYSTNSDGASPGALILSGNILYGTAGNGGSSGRGTVFALDTTGTTFATLHNFTALTGSFNSDGAGPSGLFLSDNTLYGTAANGGGAGNGTVYALNTNGTGFVTLHSFTTASGSSPTYINNDGVSPYGAPIFSANVLYGTTYSGGTAGHGVVFSISFAVQLAISRSGANMVLTWPTNAADFTLQSTTSLVSPVVWNAVSPDPIVIGGQNIVFNPITATPKFYRLSQ